jgi:menaquinone reductase, multiheme cytochrome c subunit
MMARNTLVFGFGLAVALLVGWVAFPRVLYSRQNQPIAFHHKTHAEKSGSAQCSDCHALSDDGKFAGIPSTGTCAGCHAEPMGASKDEAVLVNDFIKAGKPVPWKVYARQPANVWFSHAIHTRRGGLECKQCHSTYGETDEVRVYEQNRISGYSRDIWGHSISRIRFTRHDGMKMSDCEDCHRQRHVETSCLSCHQ